MELHIWMREPDHNIKPLTIFYPTMTALINNQLIIHTTQPHFCSTRWLLKQYKIIIHMINGENVEIKLGQCCGREIREGHNLEKMLLAGEFGKVIS